MEQTSEGRLQTSPAAREEGCWQTFWFRLTQMALSRNWLCPWTRTFAVAKDQILSFLTTNLYSYNEVLPYLEKFNDPSEDLTFKWCEIRGSMSLHSPTQRQRLSNTASISRLPSSSTKASVNKKKASTSMTNHDPRMNRISSIVLVELPPNSASIRRSWYLRYLLCWIWLLEGCLCVFLEWVLLPCACACFWPFGLTSLKFVFPPIYLCQLGGHT
jgi:hypothetical protein